jgi:hypothetical protein
MPALPPVTTAIFPINLPMLLSEKTYRRHPRSRVEPR